MSTAAANVLLVVAWMTEMFGVILDSTWTVAGSGIMVVAIAAVWFAWPYDE